MKRSIKCFGVLLALATIFGLSLHVSSDVNAIQYTIDSIFVHTPAFPDSDNSLSVSQDNLSIILIDTPSNLNLTPRNSSYIQSQYDSSSQKCKWYSNTWSYVNPGYDSNGITLEWGGNFLAPWDLGVTLSPQVLCKSMYEYGSDHTGFNVPNYDVSSVPLNKRLNVQSMLPYNYMYNTIPFSNTRTVEGVDYDSKFDISELLQNTTRPADDDFVYYTDKINEFNFPLNFDASKEALVSGDQISLSGRIDFGSGLTNSEVSNLSASLYVSYFASNSSQGFSIPCSLSYYVNGSNKSIQYLCSGSTPVNLNRGWYSFNFKFGLLSDNNANQTPFTSTPQSMTFSDPVITFFGDPDTLGGVGSVAAGGSFPNVAPGIAEADPNSSDANWFSSLVNLFSFGFFNPFAPIFNLFSDQNSCANIPIIASMIHSQETQVCPWFDSNTRNIVTPVLGLASMMLVFGFAVRWLGSSSGNLFEDSRSEEVSNQGGSWGHFKKGGK